MGPRCTTCWLPPPRRLGRIGGFDFSGDGRFLVTHDLSGNAVLRDLRALAPVSPGPSMRADICRAGGDSIRPFAYDLRTGAAEGLGHIRRHLQGRPWNPCDWRGLLAIFPHEADGWFEGPRQWWRLMRVRNHWGGVDYACAETASRASDKTRAARRDMYARFGAAPRNEGRDGD